MENIEKVKEGVNIPYPKNYGENSNFSAVEPG
jgi:hypothetical protein